MYKKNKIIMMIMLTIVGLFNAEVSLYFFESNDLVLSNYFYSIIIIIYKQLHLQVIASNINNLYTIIRFQVFLFNTDNSQTVIWFQEIIPI